MISNFKIKLLSTLLFGILFMFSGCDKEAEIAQQEDQDMDNAMEMVEGYLGADEMARRGNSVAVTVLQYYNGILYYATNTDEIRGYHPVEETTITAHVSPGDYIFWFAGRGVDYLDEIDFDVVARYSLGDNASAAYPATLWLVRVPEDIEVDENNELKYDIVYGCKDANGNPIRLDPKIKIQ